MEILRQPEKFSLLLHRLRNGAKGILFCDYDGTLAPFQEDPKAARPYPWVSELLREIVATGKSRVIIVTGRTIRDLLQLLSIEKLEIWGSHGRERFRPDGLWWTWEPDPKEEQILDQIHCELGQVLPDIRVERKVGCLAVHWRGLMSQDVQRLQQIIEETLRKWDCGGVVKRKPFHMGIELQVPGPNKGNAVSTVLAEEFGQAVATCYLGDDLTDEAAFKALGDDGVNILVSATARPTLADIRLENEDEVRVFLEGWRDATKGGADDGR